MNSINESNRIQEWLIEEIKEMLKMEKSEIDIHQSFSSFGLDSAAIMMLSGELGRLLQRKISPTVFWEFTSIHALAAALEGENDRDMPDTERAARQPNAHNREPIAIVGMGCRFPGANGVRAFWELLIQGKDAIAAYPADRLKLNEPVVGREGGYIEGIDGFDYSFFNLSYREAIRMDPQQRILLEVVWEAFEDAGIPPSDWANTMSGTFIGISNNDYGRKDLQAEEPHIFSLTGNALSIAANRLSYLYNLNGPSLAIDTACSSSLAAVHMACQSIWSGDSKQAVAGGVNIILTDGITTSLSNAGMLAADDRCKTFDAKADGYVRGEGCGAILLKPLSKAIEDGNDIYSVIRGSSLNQDGRSNGITAPNQHAQEKLLQAAYTQAGIKFDDIGYIESHGTGTYLGDPIEVKALGNVVSAGRTTADAYFLGSVKTNIGHLEAAAGIAGLIKTALVLKHGIIPPNLHFEKWNDEIPHAKYAVRVPVKCETLTPGSCAGVSSFGFGGTNVHVAMGPSMAEQSYAAQEFDEQPELFVLSARRKEGLSRLAEQYIHMIRSGYAEQEWQLSELCSSLWQGRQHHSHRLALVASSFDGLADGLESFHTEAEHPGLKYGNAVLSEQEIAFRFSDAGSDQEAYVQPIQDQSFQQSFSVVNHIVQMQGGFHLEEEKQRSAFYVFAWQYAFGQMLRDWGIVPKLSAGSGVGAITAAVLNGTITLVEAVQCLKQGDYSAGDSYELVRSASECLIYIGPLSTLSAEDANRQSHASGSRKIILGNGQSRLAILGLAGELYTAGFRPKLYVDKGRTHMLPVYSWHHQSCWRATEKPQSSSFECFC